eukprot:TRINITY_DN11453_c0_g1_i1.p1 TRINITY_DN11453_c0_g1~~TRINITY_DN11453_c0_g1_i1.p1  ORF type:complete len:113 (-),score=40.05 TRINITY_DN11453_c0_g1_i1:289-627(-)
MAQILARIIVKLVVNNARVIGQAVIDAWKIASEKPLDHLDHPVKMSVQEALQILNADIKAKPSRSLLRQNYELLKKLNDPAEGGSVYLYDKINEAKDTVDEAVKKEELKLPP